MSKFIKDSNNNYTLYVDQGADYYLPIQSDSFNVDSLTGYEFHGSIKRHEDSKNSFPIGFGIDLATNVLSIMISSETTSELKEDIYLFDVFAKKEGIVSKIIFGKIVVSRSMTEF